MTFAFTSNLSKSAETIESKPRPSSAFDQRSGVKCESKPDTARRKPRLLRNSLPSYSMPIMLHARTLTVVFAVVCIFGLSRSLWNFHHSPAPSPPTRPAGAPDSSQFTLSPAYGATPWVAGWTSWFDPHAWGSNKGAAAKGGKIDKNWNILYHLGGNGPWIQKTEGVVTNEISPPPGCRAKQVHMLSRHGERYPTKNAGARMLDMVNKLNGTGLKLKGDLAFMKKWKFFVTDPDHDFEQLTYSGPYAGTLETFETGVKFRTRYHDLVSRVLEAKDKTKLWASDSNRVIETARYFSLGFFGLPYEHASSVDIIPEDADRGGDTLTPSDTCLKYTTDSEHGHDDGDHHLKQWQTVYLEAVGKRLQKDIVAEKNAPAHEELTTTDLYAMQEICGFETTARGKSPWCDVFTTEEWESFEYARDLLHYYRSGPGNKFGKALGSLWLSATAKLLEAGPSAGAFFFSFSHDSDIAPVLAALDVMHDAEKLPTDRIAKDRKWRMSQVLPMGGRIVLERLTCEKHSSITGSTDGTFIRLNINDGIVAIPGCVDGPGLSCSLTKFLDFLSSKLSAAGEFKEKCGLPTDASGGITFLHQR